MITFIKFHVFYRYSLCTEMLSCAKFIAYSQFSFPAYCCKQLPSFNLTCQ
uniref:Uncharacterized protein n=1 Tax=Arundo donax TaxID=35708 RepID=A0A0A9H123_ARUDO